MGPFLLLSSCCALWPVWAGLAWVVADQSGSGTDGCRLGLFKWAASVACWLWSTECASGAKSCVLRCWWPGSWQLPAIDDSTNRWTVNHSLLSQLEQCPMVSRGAHLVKDWSNPVYEHWKVRLHMCFFLLDLKALNHFQRSFSKALFE